MLNIQQRKSLEKIVKTAIARKRNELPEKREEKEKEMVKGKWTTAQKISQRITTLEKLKDKLDEELRQMGFSTNYEGELSVNLSPLNQKLVNLWEREQERKFDETETKLVAKLWGVETDFNSLMKDLEKELAKL